MSKYDEVAKKIFIAVGGKNNIQEFFHCVARLRLYLKDSQNVDLDALRKIPEIFEVEYKEGQLQILLGENVEQYYSSLIKITNQGFDTAQGGELKMSKSNDKDKQLAEQIVKLVGGKENVNSLIHCVTRLRFKLKDESKADDEAIKNLHGVMGVAHAGGQYQVIIGNNVADIYDQVMPLLGLSTRLSRSLCK